jgi:hypothetical protein
VEKREVPLCEQIFLVAHGSTKGMGDSYRTCVERDGAIVATCDNATANAVDLCPYKDSAKQTPTSFDDDCDIYYARPWKNMSAAQKKTALANCMYKYTKGNGTKYACGGGGGGGGGGETISITLVLIIAAIVLAGGIAYARARANKFNA